MTSKKNWLGILAIVLVFGLMAIGCGDDDDNDDAGTGGITGTWGATIQGQSVTVVLTATNWTFTVPTMPQLNDSGTFTMDGITATLRRTIGNVVVGTAVLLDSNTISLTLNNATDIPGTYTLTRR